MAGEVGHVVYGARLLTYLNDRVQQPAFWAGTLFPDIRHLGAVSRHRTHPENVSLESLVGKNDFATGLRTHAWIDRVREEFLREHNIKEVLMWHPFVPHALKLIEDEFLYDRFDDWNLIQRVLNKVYEDELELVPAREKVIRWHEVLQSYLREPPTDDSRRQLSLDIGLSEAMANEINLVVQALQKNKETRKVIDRFLAHLENLLR